MIRSLPIMALLALLGCDQQPASPSLAVPAVVETATPAPGSGAVAPTPSNGVPDEVKGRVFRMKAGGQNPDPNSVLAALKGGKKLPSGIEEIDKRSQADDAATATAKKRAIDTVIKMYTMVAGKPMDVLETTEVSGMWRVTFQTRGTKEAPSTVHVTKDGKLAFEGGFELNRRYDKMQIDHNFAQCLHVRGLRVIGDSRDKTTTAQLKQVGSFAGKIFVDCGRTKDGCAKLMKKLGIKKLPVIEQGEDRFTGPRPRQFLETLSGCK